MSFGTKLTVWSVIHHPNSQCVRISVTLPSPHSTGFCKSHYAMMLCSPLLRLNLGSNNSTRLHYQWQLILQKLVACFDVLRASERKTVSQRKKRERERETRKKERKKDEVGDRKRARAWEYLSYLCHKSLPLPCWIPALSSELLSWQQPV